MRADFTEKGDNPSSSLQGDPRQILLSRRLRQEDCEFEASLGYMVKLCLKTKQKITNVYSIFLSSILVLHVY
jgi:hypothetical protein